VVADEGARMVLAVRTRSTGSRALSLRVAGSLLGHLLLRSLDRAQRIHRAMLARGFDGEVRVLRPTAIRAGDALFVAIWGEVFLTARLYNLPEWLGRWITGAGS
jgi:cobalt/nickel transport system permease protein